MPKSTIAVSSSSLPSSSAAAAGLQTVVWDAVGCSGGWTVACGVSQERTYHRGTTATTAWLSSRLLLAATSPGRAFSSTTRCSYRTWRRISGSPCWHELRLLQQTSRQVLLHIRCSDLQLTCLHQTVKSLCSKNCVFCL